MFPQVWRRIDAGEFPSQPATLHGYARYRIQDAVFPGIIQVNEESPVQESPVQESQVQGVLYQGLDEDTLFELDAYESDLYNRIAVTATTANGPIDCTAFVIPASHSSALTNEPWDAKQFEQQELAKYLNG